MSAKPSGSIMNVLISYENERHMAPQTLKNMKANIFKSSDKDDCKKYLSQTLPVCMYLSQWCIMTGPAPHGARFTVADMKAGKCR